MLLILLQTGGEQDSEDGRLDQEERPHARAQPAHEGFTLHACVLVEVDHQRVAVHADEHEEHGAAVVVGAEEGNHHPAQEAAEGPVAAQGELCGHHGDEGSGQDVTERQMELEHRPGAPFGRPEAEHQEAGTIEDGAQQEDHTQEHRDRQVLGLNPARPSVTADPPRYVHEGVAKPGISGNTGMAWTSGHGTSS